MNNIRYEDIKLIGMELFRKNNETFLKSNLSPIMSRIFKAANSPHITDTDNEYYMKSGSIPNKVFYIYSDELSEKDPEKILDIVYFNGDRCVWIYTKNAINMIDKKPVDTIYNIYHTLMTTFMQFSGVIYGNFINTEHYIAELAMCMNLIIFLNETYGALDVEECKIYLTDNHLREYEKDSCKEFIDEVCENCTSKNYFNNREYLDSYLLLRKKPRIISV